MSRHASGPEADGRVHVGVLAGADPKFITVTAARGYVDRARATLVALQEADTRFAELLTQYGTTWELVHDYSIGAVTLARIDEDGVLEWDAAYRPSM